MVDTTLDTADVNVNVNTTDNTRDNSTGHETTEHQEHQEHQDTKPEPKPFKAWELKPKESTHVPYDRFQELVTQRDVLAQALQSVRNTQPQPQPTHQEKPKSLEEIKPEDYDDPIKFLQDRDAALRRSLLEELGHAQSQTQQQRQAQEYIENLGRTFSTNVEASISHNPEIRNAVEFFDSQAANIDADIIHELMIDENAGELMHAITTDEALLREMFKARPADFIRKIHKMSAKIDKASLYNKSSDEDNDTTETNSVKQEIRKTVPTQVKPSAGRPTKDPAKMSVEEYRQFVKNGYK